MRRALKCRLGTTVLLGCLLFVVAPGAMAQGPQRGPTIVSPEVLPDHRVTFRIQAPKASEITLRGDWMEGTASEKLSKDDKGLWSATVGPLVPDFYSYTFTVDGVKTLDPRNPMIKQGITGLDNMFFVAGEQADFEDNKPVPHGQIRQVWYRSTTLDTQRRMHVYTPPGYDGGSERYPVFYLLHGVGDKDFTLSGSKALAEVLTKHGIKNQLHISGGGHTWINWRHYLNDLVPRLFGAAAQNP